MVPRAGDARLPCSPESWQGSAQVRVNPGGCHRGGFLQSRAGFHSTPGGLYRSKEFTKAQRGQIRDGDLLSSENSYGRTRWGKSGEIIFFLKFLGIKCPSHGLIYVPGRLVYYHQMPTDYFRINPVHLRARRIRIKKGATGRSPLHFTSNFLRDLCALCG